MKAIILLLLFPCAISAQSAFGQSSISGIIYDYDNLTPIKFATLALIKEDRIVKGVETDLNGKYLFQDIVPGQYYLECSYVGYEAKRLKCKVHQDVTTIIDIIIKEGIIDEGFGCMSYQYPLIEFDNTSSGAIFVAKDIRNMAITK